MATLAALEPLGRFFVDNASEGTGSLIRVVPSLLLLLFAIGAVAAAYRLGAHWRGRSLRAFLRSSVAAGFVTADSVSEYLRKKYNIGWRR